MKRIFFTILALLTLAIVSFAQLRDILPPTVQLLLEERALYGQQQSLNNNADLRSYNPRLAPTRLINGIEMADVFIDFERPEVIPILKAHGVVVNCVFDDFLTAQAPVDALRALCRLKGVTHVEVSGVAQLCSDSTLRVTRAAQVLDGVNYGLPQAYDGTGVIIGMIDTGYDYQHTAFRRSDDVSKTRIVRVYDPNNTTGHPAIVGNNVLAGSVFMGEQIDTLTCDSKIETHGTNTTGMAAGRNVNGYGGTAPGAEIVLCTSRTIHGGVSELELINCMKYIYSYADSVGKPCVINMSLSNRFGPHDGTDRVSKAIAQCVGPGRIFVVAAGNNGGENGYTHGPTLASKPHNMLIGYYNYNADDSYYYENTWLTAWVRDKNVRPIIQFHILDKQTNHIVWESELISTFKKYFAASAFKDYFTGSGGYLSGLVSLNPSNMKFEASCEFKNLRSTSYTVDAEGKITSRYQIGVSIYPPSVAINNQPDSCYVDSWICTANGRYNARSAPVYRDVITESGDTITTQLDNFYRSPSSLCSMGTYAINDSVISAGSFYGRNNYYSLTNDTTYFFHFAEVGRYSNFTSYQYPGYGPTGKALPTVTAPGDYVISPGNNLGLSLTYAGTAVMQQGRNYWSIMSGTSMAAPAVAGIIAQWLQINPHLSPSQVKDVIAQTAIKDGFTQGAWYRYGPNGKINAIAGARLLLANLPPQPQVLIGDVTGDGIINIKDVTWLIDYLLWEPAEGFVVEAADVFPDGKINIRDLTRLIDMLLEN